MSRAVGSSQLMRKSNIAARRRCVSEILRAVMECQSDILYVLFRRATVEEIISRINVSSTSSKICESCCCLFSVKLLDSVSCSYAVICVCVWHSHKVVVNDNSQQVIERGRMPCILLRHYLS